MLADLLHDGCGKQYLLTMATLCVLSCNQLQLSVWLMGRNQAHVFPIGPMSVQLRLGKQEMGPNYF